MNNDEQLLKFPDAEGIELARQRAQKQYEESLKHSREAPAKFLKAWLKGVKIIGWEFFKHNDPLYGPSLPLAKSIEDVTNKWQVCPDYDFIHENIGVMSRGQAILLASMCSFYNSNWGGDLMRDVGINGLSDISTRLDTDGAEVISELFINYNGW